MRRFSSVSYRNGKDILPTELLLEIQKYIQGEIIYIPREEKTRAAWGQLNGTRTLLDRRNNEIYILYKNGHSADELVEKYNLSEDSIRKILMKSGRCVKRVSAI
jgi:Mor family transcriptional regulator